MAAEFPLLFCDKAYGCVSGSIEVELCRCVRAQSEACPSNAHQRLVADVAYVRFNQERSCRNTHDDGKRVARGLDSGLKPAD